jgi:hypothetical protein
VSIAAQAAALADRQGNAKLAEAIRNRIEEYYKKGRPYIDERPNIDVNTSGG